MRSCSEQHILMHSAWNSV